MHPRLILALVLMAVGTASAQEPNGFPYDEFAKATEENPGEKIDGETVIAAYLKSAGQGEALDSGKANFRIRMPDGSIIPMKCDTLAQRTEDAKDDRDTGWIAKGFTHKLWIPKDAAKYKGAMMLNDLAPGSLEIQFPLPPRPQVPAP